MSIAFQRSSATPDSAQRSGFVRDMPLIFGGFQGDRRFPPPEAEDDGEDGSGSSSIGRDSDLSSDGEDSGEDCGGPLDSMADLEEVLPVKKGISKFYTGKSKSFTSLADATSAPSIKHLVKPENPYTKKRKNLPARNNLFNRLSPPKESTIISTSKKPSHEIFAINFSKSSDIRAESQSRSASPSTSRPPLHPKPKPSVVYGSCSSPPRRNSPWRSFSLSDLQSAAGNCND